MNDATKPPTTNRGVRTTVLVPKSIYSNLDWLTATTKVDETGVEWLLMFHEYQAMLEDMNQKPVIRNSSWMGFDGWSCEGMRWGYNPKNKHFLFIASGSAAGYEWAKILPGATNITRLDLAVTILLPETNQDYLTGQYRAVSETEAQKRNYTIFYNSKGGKTLYVGKRESEQMGRIYDKGVESGEYKPGNLWRFEVELKKPRSFQVATDLYRGWVDQKENTQQRILDYVHNWFKARGIEPLFDGNVSDINTRREIRATTLDKTLAWYRTQVRPSVAELIKQGYGDEVLDALGLKSASQPTLPGLVGPLDGPQGQSPNQV